jgi:hypothetical protein
VQNYVDAPFEPLSDDEHSLLVAFQKYSVDCIVVGGYAVRFYGRLRPVSDLDLVVDRDQCNLTRLEIALSSAGVSQAKAVAALFAEKPNPKWHWMDGNYDHYVDLLGNVEGLSFGDLFNDAPITFHDDLRLKVISLAHLITVKERGLSRNKRGDKTETDREDLAFLKEVLRRENR